MAIVVGPVATGIVRISVDAMIPATPSLTNVIEVEPIVITDVFEHLHEVEPFNVPLITATIAPPVNVAAPVVNVADLFC